MWLGFQRVPEEHQQVNFPFRDLGANLLVASERATEQAMDVVPAQVFLEQPASGAGGVEFGYQVVKPQGAFYFFPKSPLEDEVEFVKKLADKKVLVVPGRGFGLPGYFRISYCLPDSVIEGSIAGFEKTYHECQA